jgi:hypothetical protein
MKLTRLLRDRVKAAAAGFVPAISYTWLGYCRSSYVLSLLRPGCLVAINDFGSRKSRSIWIEASGSR